ncbi:MAG: NlpC/P60 family protein [bacterium]
MKKLYFIFILLINLNLYSELQKMIVSVPVADLRSKTVKVDPSLTPPALLKDMNGQLSQLLFNECILAEESTENPSWLNVEAIEQEIKNSENNFIPCPGFIEKNQAIEVEEFPKFNLVTQVLWTNIFEQPDINSNKTLSICIGTKFEGEKVNENWWKIKLPENKNGYIQANDIYEITNKIQETEDELRNNITLSAMLFLNCPYVFGGRSPYKKDLNNQITGVDCSDFINLVFRSCGFQIPKNSPSQWEKSNKIKTGSDLKPGDLVFLFDDQTLLRRLSGKTRVVHVMMYLGDNLLIESSGGDNSDKNVRIISAIDYLGKIINKIESGKDRCKINNFLIYFGSFLNSKEIILELRNKELENNF